ncbi:hypothetical protein [Streptomyces aureus]|uniref:hypothetical protein n=1 Tax=Streptomyces aureus TaxID=193461 RepID=UPI0033E4D7EC
METVRGGRRAAGPGALAAFARFVLCGGGVGLASSFAVAALASWMYWGLANALVTAASTLLATELHARFTFGAGGRATWRQHMQSSGSAAAAYAVTCAAMLALHLVVASPGAVLEQAVYLSASGLAGAARFVVLRLVVFARGHKGGTRDATVATRRGRAGGADVVPGARPVPGLGPIPGARPVPAVAGRVAAPGGQAELCCAA